MTSKTFLFIPNISLNLETNDEVGLKKFLYKINQLQSSTQKDVYTLSFVSGQETKETECSIGFTLKTTISAYEQKEKLPETADYAIVELDDVTKRQVDVLISQNSINEIKQHFFCAYLLKNITPKQLHEIKLEQQQKISLEEENDENLEQQKEKAEPTCCCFPFMGRRQQSKGYQIQVDTREEQHTFKSTMPK